MQQCIDFNWCENLAAHLPDVSIGTSYNHPIFIHRSGLRLNVHAYYPGTRRRFSIYPVLADNSSRQYPTQPPDSITLDSKRPLPKLAQELQRRLIDPALIWFTGANAWRTQDNAEQQRLHAIRGLFSGYCSFEKRAKVTRKGVGK